MSIVEAVVIIVALLVVADLIKFKIKAHTERYNSTVQQPIFPIREDPTGTEL